MAVLVVFGLTHIGQLIHRQPECIVKLDTDILRYPLLKLDQGVQHFCLAKTKTTSVRWPPSTPTKINDGYHAIRSLTYNTRTPNYYRYHRPVYVQLPKSQWNSCLPNNMRDEGNPSDSEALKEFSLPIRLTGSSHLVRDSKHTSPPFYYLLVHRFQFKYVVICNVVTFPLLCCVQSSGEFFGGVATI